MNRRYQRGEGSDAESHRPDFLSRVGEVCRLRTDQDRSTAGAEIVERSSGMDGAEFDHLVVRYTRGPWTKELVVGACNGPVSAETITQFRDAVCAHTRTEREPELVYRSGSATPDAERLAREDHIWLREFAEYQHVWDHHDYLKNQTERLRADGEYPLRQHVDKRWSELGESDARPTTAAEQIMALLSTDGPRFILVLGDFGTGKTFLLRTLADRLAREGSGLVPVLVTMRDLTKGRTLDQLLAQHMSEENSYHRESFRYLLREGKVALLFDGFDELAQRTDYDHVKDHFNTLREAAGGVAKVIVTSRHQYFATDRDVRTALGGEAQALPGSRIMRLHPLDSGQRRTLVVEGFDDEAVAEHFLNLLGSFSNLLSLAENPRMLSFMIRWYRDGLLTDERLTAGGDAAITAGRLYERLLTTWLTHELTRQDEPGGPGALSVAERLDALGEIALQLWRSGEATVRTDQLGSAAAKVIDLDRLRMRQDEAAQAVGSSTVLVRVGDHAFSFIHQSVLEWLIARWIAQGGQQRLAGGPLSPLMVDFLCDLAGDDVVVRWASQIATGVEPAAKANAVLILHRRGVTVRQVNYAGADLRGRDLSTQDLTAADLSAAELSGAVLPRAMQGANLRRARLVAARLDGADLTDADLSGADLTQARMIGADLRGAGLVGARLDRAVLVGALVDPEAFATTAGMFGAALPGSPAHVVGMEPASAINAVAAVPEGILATGHDDGTVRLWDLSTGAVLRILHGHTREVRALAVDPAGSWLASAGDDATVRLWDLSTGATLRILEGHTRWVRALVVGPAGRWLASAGGEADATVRVWDLSTGAVVQILKGHSSWVRALVVGPAGRWLASAGADAMVRLWDPTTGAAVRTLEGHSSGVRALAVDPAGRWLASAGADATVRVWNTDSGTTLRTLEGHTRGVWALAVDPTGRWLASAGDDATVRVWDSATGIALRTLEGHGRGVRALAADSAGSWLASAGADATVRVWDPAAGTALRALEGHTRGVRALAVDPAGSWLVSAGDDPTVRVRNPSTGAVMCTLEGHTGRVVALAADPAERWLASAGDDATVRVWDPAAGTALRALEGHSGGVRALVVGPAGRWLASAGDDATVRLWDPAAGTALRALEGHSGGVRALVVGPAGGWLASAGDDATVRLWDPATGTALRTLEGHAGRVVALAADPAGGWLASAGDDATVRLWDPATGTALRTLEGHSRGVRALAVDPARRWLACAGDDAAVRLWDPVTGTLLATLVASEEGWAVLLPDGSYKLHGQPAGLWWVIGLCRFDPADLPDIALYQSQLWQLPADAPIRYALGR